MKTFSREQLPQRPWNIYKKKTLTQAQRIDGEFTVLTREGQLRCPDGYLALDSDGWPYPIHKEEFEGIYELADGIGVARGSD
jgi:hypothetical protein